LISVHYKFTDQNLPQFVIIYLKAKNGLPGWNATVKHLKSVTRGRCYFLLFLPIFGEKFGVFLKNQCYDHLFA
jgi:hypothetical protein